MPYGWGTSDRRARLPKDWSKRRAKAKARAHGLCQATTHEPGCNGIGNECDHIISGDDHSMANLQWLSGPCHKAKTQHESQQAQARQRDARTRTPEPHPGLIRTHGGR